ncbi:MAG: TIGR00730 family Rossman fold protein [Actinobacteria bacterium]|nr:TIGR00730 family Rossman fold protein [Actinomycetota bacterium]
MQRVCVFCGTSAGDDEVYADAARDFGTALAEAGIDLVYGGSSLGMMRLVADAVLDRGRQVIGVMPRHLTDRDVPYERATELHLTETMHERKAHMFELADAFVALPGGLGTLDELMEISTWAQLGLHDKPIAILNVAGYFDQLASWLDHAVEHTFLAPRHRERIAVLDDLAALLHYLSAQVAKR